MRKVKIQFNKRKPSNHNRRGFNYRDLLCVLMVVAMLAVFAIPSLLNAYTRRKVVRAKQQLRIIAVGLETYYLDNGTYPPAADQSGNLVSWQIPSCTNNLESWTHGYVSSVLSTPVVHLETVPFDPFGPKRKPGQAKSYHYASRCLSFWILTSRGPDLDDDMNAKDYVIDQDYGEISLYLKQFSGPYVEYDPTNGTISNGDIYRTGP